MRIPLLARIAPLLIAGTLPAQDFELLSFEPASTGFASGGNYEAALRQVSSAVGHQAPEGGEFGLAPMEILGLGSEPSAPPTLEVRLLSDRTIRLAWGAEAAGFTLERSDNLRDWSVESVGGLTGAGLAVVPTSAPQRYFRLRR